MSSLSKRIPQGSGEEARGHGTFLKAWVRMTRGIVDLGGLLLKVLRHNVEVQVRYTGSTPLSLDSRGSPVHVVILLLLLLLRPERLQLSETLCKVSL